MDSARRKATPEGVRTQMSGTDPCARAEEQSTAPTSPQRHADQRSAWSPVQIHCRLQQRGENLFRLDFQALTGAQSSYLHITVSQHLEQAFCPHVAVDKIRKGVRVLQSLGNDKLHHFSLKGSCSMTHTKAVSNRFNDRVKRFAHQHIPSSARRPCSKAEGTNSLEEPSLAVAGWMIKNDEIDAVIEFMHPKC